MRTDGWAERRKEADVTKLTVAFRISVDALKVLHSIQTVHLCGFCGSENKQQLFSYTTLTHCGRVTQICLFNTVNLGTSASSP